MAIINTFGSTSLPDLTNAASASDIRSGKQVVNANGDILTGTMPTITKPNPSISLSTGGLITATYNQTTSGYSASGTTRATKQISSSDISTLKPENIKSGVNILGVTGTLGTSGDGYFYGTQSNGVQLTESAKLEFSFPGVDWTDIMYWGDYHSSSGYPNFSGFCNGPANTNSKNGIFMCSASAQSGTKVVRSSSSNGKTKVVADLTVSGIDYFYTITVIAIKE